MSDESIEPAEASDGPIPADKLQVKGPPGVKGEETMRYICAGRTYAELLEAVAKNAPQDQIGRSIGHHVENMARAARSADL